MAGGGEEYGYHSTRTRAQHDPNDAITKTFEEYRRIRELQREAELAEHRTSRERSSQRLVSSATVSTPSTAARSTPQSDALERLRSRNAYLRGTSGNFSTSSSAYGSFSTGGKGASLTTSAASSRLGSSTRACSDSDRGTSSAGAGLRSRSSEEPAGGRKARVGLSNLGNTCFMNSTLQCLFGVREVGDFFNGEGSSLEMSAKETKVARAFQDLVRKVLRSEHGSVVTPSSFLDKVKQKDRKWGGMRQHDSQEFLQFLLNVLREQCNRNAGSKPKYKELEGKGTRDDQADEALRYYKSWHDSIIDDIFGGLLESSITCDNCGHISFCFDPFLDLSLPVPGSGADGGPVRLKDCLTKFTEREDLEDVEGYKCEKCKWQRGACKKLTIYKAPKVLILHLKRFSGGGLSRFSRFSKNSARVSFDLELDLGRHCNLKEGSSRYKLFAVSHHSGSLSGGHYYAEVENAYDGRWYNFNDSMVSSCRQPETSSSTAYVLYYRRA